MKNKSTNVAIIGACTLKGRELIDELENSSLKIDELFLYDKKDQAGHVFSFGSASVMVNEFSENFIPKAQVAFFLNQDPKFKSVINEWAQENILCIDAAGIFHANQDLPLLSFAKKPASKGAKNIYVCPLGISAILSQVLKPLHEKFLINQAIVSTYQAVCDEDHVGTKELEEQVRDLFNLREVNTSHFSKRIAFNVLPWVPQKSDLDSNNKCKDEERFIFETKRLLNHADLKMDITCVYVPVFNGNGFSVALAFDQKTNVEEVKKELKTTKNIIVVDEQSPERYPSVVDAASADEILVGRVRPNLAAQNGVMLFICADNLRSGFASYAVGIVKGLLQE